MTRKCFSFIEKHLKGTDGWNEKGGAVERNEAGKRKCRKRGHCRNLSSFLRQKKKLEEKEGISSTIQPRGFRDRKRCVYLSASFPVPSTIPVSTPCSRVPTSLLARPSHFDAFTCENLIQRLSFVVLFLFVNTSTVSARNKHPWGKPLGIRPVPAVAALFSSSSRVSTYSPFSDGPAYCFISSLNNVDSTSHDRTLGRWCDSIYPWTSWDLSSEIFIFYFDVI